MIFVGSLVFVLAIGGAAFWGGMNVGKAQAQDAQNSFFASRGFDPNNLPAGGVQPATGGGGAGGFAGGGQGAGANGAVRAQRGAFGTISKVDGNTLIVTDNQGGEVTVTLSASTAITKTVSGTKDDLKTGTRVVVQGDRSGNNVAATVIQIANQDGTGPGIFGRPVGSPTPTK
jgi:hypothetical protein